MTSNFAIFAEVLEHGVFMTPRTTSSKGFTTRNGISLLHWGILGPNIVSGLLVRIGDDVIYIDHLYHVL